MCNKQMPDDIACIVLGLLQCFMAADYSERIKLKKFSKKVYKQMKSIKIII